jgi:hypothetical protein
VPVWKVADRIDTGDGIERSRREIKWAACIGDRKYNSIGEAPLPHPRLRDSYGGGFEVDAMHPAACAFCDP